MISMNELRLSQGKLHETQMQLSSCEALLERYKSKEEALERQLQHQKEDLRQSTELLSRSRDEALQDVNRQLRASFGVHIPLSKLHSSKGSMVSIRL